MILRPDFRGQAKFKRSAKKCVGAKTDLPVKRLFAERPVKEVPEKVNAYAIAKRNVRVYPAELCRANTPSTATFPPEISPNRTPSS